MEDFLVEFLKEFSGTFWWFPRRIHGEILETSGITESNFRWFFRGIPQRKIYEYTHMCSKKLNIQDILSFQERFPRRFQDKKSGKKCRSSWWHFLEYLWKDLLKEDFSEISGGMPGLICGGDLNKITERKIGKK